MAEKTAIWTWRDRYEDPSTLSFGAAELAFIRGLAAWWDSAEAGAAGVTSELLAEDGLPEEEEALIDLFLTTATLPATEGRVRNPSQEVDADEAAWLLEDIPDAEVRALFLAGEDFDFAATPEDLALWQAANLGGEGIDCKRPFGSGNVSRDVRDVLDPGKALSNAAFGKLRRRTESRLLCLMQLSLQTAELPFDTYTRDKSYQWVPASSLDREASEAVTRDEWAMRVLDIVHDQSEDYIETATAVQQLVWEDRLQGDYAALNRKLRLHDLYEDHSEPRYIGLSREMAEEGLRHFPETELPILEKAITAALVRVLNGTGDFTAAKAALQAAGIWDIDPGACVMHPMNPEFVMYLEGMIARRGLGELDEDTFEPHLFRGIEGPSSFGYDIVHGLPPYEDGCPEDVPLFHYTRAKAMAAQILVMRGLYRP